MNPLLLLGLAAGAGILLVSGASTRPLPTVPPAAPLPPAPASTSVAFTPANIRHAVSVALAREHDPSALLQFGNALAIYGGFQSESRALFARAVSLQSSQAVASVKAETVQPGQSDPWFLGPPPSYSAASYASFAACLAHYSGSSALTTANVLDAVSVAMTHETSSARLQAFATQLLAMDWSTQGSAMLGRAGILAAHAAQASERHAHAARGGY